MALSLMAVSVVAMSTAWAQEVVKPWKASVSGGVVYDDNRDGVENDAEDNFDIYGDARLDYMLRDDQGSLNLYLQPILKWHSNPRTDEDGAPQNDTELFGAIGFDGLYQLMPRLGVKLADSLMYNDDPAITEAGVGVRLADNHIRNTLTGSVDAEVTPKTLASLIGRNEIKRYDEEVVADEQDEDIWGGELQGKYLLGEEFSVLCFAGVTDFENSSMVLDRGSTVVSAGAGVEKTFSPDLVGDLRLGYQEASYDREDLDNEDGMMADVSLVMRAESATRFRLEAMYGFYNPSVRPYSLQQLWAVKGAVEHDVTQRIEVIVDAQYTDSEYPEEGAELPGGDENLTTLGAHAFYKIDHNWSVGGGYSFESWDSEVRESFDRNMFDAMVKAEL
jgi:hypothetical protein